jgi:hypothetical protein
MKFCKIFWVVIPMLWLVTSCSSGSSSGGGGSTNGGGGETTPTTFTSADLQGTWQFKADREITPFTLTGTMTFDGDVRLIGYTNDYCPGRQIVDAEFWLWDYGFVKGRNYAFCSDTNTYTKYALNFTGADKKTLVGLMDLHYFNDAGEELYERYDITYQKQGTSASQKIQNSKTQIRTLKSVR